MKKTKYILVLYMLLIVLLTSCKTKSPVDTLIDYQLKNSFGSYTVLAPQDWKIVHNDQNKTVNLVDERTKTILTIYPAETKIIDIAAYAKEIQEAYYVSLTQRNIFDMSVQGAREKYGMKFIDDKKTYWYIWLEQISEDTIFLVSFSTPESNLSLYNDEFLQKIRDAFVVKA